MKDKNGNIRWNLYLQDTIQGYKILMPNTFGEYEGDAPKDGFAVSWPVNPNSTGEKMIASMLNECGRFNKQVIA